MSISTGQVICALFSTQDASGNRANAASTPTGTLYLNGVAHAASVVVTNLATGLYKAVVTLPTLADGDDCDIVIVATVGTVTAVAPIWRGEQDGGTGSGIAAELAASIPIQLVASIQPQHFDVFRKDAWTQAQGTSRTIRIEMRAGEPWPDTISTAHFYCKPTRQTLLDYPTAVGLTDIACVVENATGPSRSVILELSSSQTVTLQASVDSAPGYVFWFAANKTGEPAVIRTGTMTVRPDPTA
jgi:hypothetical protein